MSSMSLNLGGLRTSVVIHGYEAVQFGTEINVSKSRASSWMISGDENTPFCIYASLENLPEHDSYVIRVYLDDVQVGKTIIRQGRPRGCYFSTVRISEMETRQFMFGRLNLSDEEAMRQPPWTESTGVIRVTLTRAVRFAPSSASFHAYSVPPQREPESEGASASFHCIQYSRSQLDAERRGALYFRIQEEALLATHVIRYRPISLLQKHGIVPYDPPPPGDGYATPMMPPMPPPPPAGYASSHHTSHGPHAGPHAYPSHPSHSPHPNYPPNHTHNGNHNHNGHSAHGSRAASRSRSRSPAPPPSKKRRVMDIDPALDREDEDREDEEDHISKQQPEASTSTSASTSKVSPAPTATATAVPAPSRKSKSKSPGPPEKKIKLDNDKEKDIESNDADATTNGSVPAEADATAEADAGANATTEA